MEKEKKEINESKRFALKTLITMAVAGLFLQEKILPLAYGESKEERNNYNNLDIPNIKGNLDVHLSRLIYSKNGSKMEYFKGVYLRDGELDISSYNAICTLLRDPSQPEDKQVVQIDIKLITLLTGIQWWLRDNGYDDTIQVVSGYRSKNYNESVGGKRSSYHLSGRAVDIRVKVPLDVIANIAKKFGVGGVGVYYDAKNKFIHLDTGPETRRW